LGSALKLSAFLGAIDRVDKSCSPAGDIAVRKHHSPQASSGLGPGTSVSFHILAVRRFMMLLRALLLVIGALNFVSGTALAVDRGQFENVPDDIRAWFKGVLSPAGVPCCDISDGHRTEYDVRAGAYWVPINGLWWQVPEKAIVRNAGNPLGEAVVWYVSLRGNIEIRCFVPADAA
jgi:hypothetical protein